MTQSVLKYETYLIRTVSRLYRQLADNYGELAYYDIPTELKMANSSTDSKVDSTKVGVWVRALRHTKKIKKGPQIMESSNLEIDKGKLVAFSLPYSFLDFEK